MNIPKSYEALAADLASEKIISKTLQGQKESYMMLADGRKFDLDAIQQRLTVAERRESEAREELLDLSRKLDVFYSRSHGIKNLSAIEDANDKSKALQQRLTVAEKRADLLEGLLKSGSSPTYAHCSAVMEALKPAAEPRKCIECESQYCHGVCVERGDDDERYKGAEGEGS